jgi:hypothetical protein
MSAHWLMLWLAICLPAVGEVAPAPWPGTPFATVKAYAWPLTHHGTVVGANGKLGKGAINPKGALLSESQTARLLKAQSRRDSDRPRARCYVPHNAFVFYSDKGKPVASIEVCFDCLGARVWPADPGCDPDYLVLAEICSELKLPYGEFKSLEELKAKAGPILQSAPPAE